MPRKSRKYSSEYYGDLPSNYLVNIGKETLLKQKEAVVKNRKTISDK